MNVVEKVLTERVQEALDFAEDQYFRSGDYVGSIIDLGRLKMYLMGYAVKYGEDCVRRRRWRSNYPYHRHDILDRLIEKRMNFYRRKLELCVS